MVDQNGKVQELPSTQSTLTYRDLVRELIGTDRDRKQIESVMRRNTAKMRDIAERLGFSDQVYKKDKNDGQYGR